MNKTDLWYPRYIGDYHRDTMHLSTVQHGAYMLLMDAYWINKGPLTYEDEKFANITRLSLSDWLATRSVIAKFFNVETSEITVWRHKRIDFELQKALKNKERKSLGAKKTNQKRWGKASLSDSLSESQSVSLKPSLNGRSSPSPSLSTPKPQNGGIKSDEEFESAKKTIGELFGRSADQSWAYGEEHALSEIIRREGFALELCEVVGFKKRILDGDIRFEWPKTLSRLLNDWTGTLDKARNYSPTQNAKPATGADRNKGTFNEGKSNLYA